MAIPSARVPPGARSAHVWHQLDVDLRRQAIAGVAQMACNCVKTHPEPSQSEKNHDDLAQPNEAPQRARDPSRSGLRTPVHSPTGP